ncbi:uncharacterized protein LOC131885109 [Tigriopus californicus]|uniref:uncharacterized protein LOC131885109 n=1 Tax=Tigriopus californicus TaxID=6832 RepID=UPI0027DAADD5|nr:uncharacterized protein LOC131885109 [Tigriopus californicus]
MRAINLFHSGGKKVYISLQNQNKQNCGSNGNRPCNGLLQDGFGNTLNNLTHVAQIKIKNEELCMWYNTQIKKFEDTLCSSTAFYLCEKLNGTPSCGEDQLYYKLDHKANFLEAQRMCQNLSLNLTVPLSKVDLEEVPDALSEDEYWIDLHNPNSVVCLDEECDNKELKTGDDLTISLAPFQGIKIEIDKPCLVGKGDEVKSKACHEHKSVICKMSCLRVLASTTNTFMSWSTTSQTPSVASNPHSCQPNTSFQSLNNSKFYKTAPGPGGFLNAQQGCAVLNMELADIQNNGDTWSILHLLGSNCTICISLDEFPLFLQSGDFRPW